MRFQWDSGNLDHIARHNVSQEEAEQVIANDPIEIGQQHRGGEQRIVHLGETDAGRILLVTVTARHEMVRVVTAYPAQRKTRSFYKEQRGQG